MLQILYKDRHYVAINKPSGLLAHRSEIDRHETRYALQMLRDQIGQRVFPVHRLDKPTSGVMLFALTSDSAAKIAQAFHDNTICKHYAAIIRGFVTSPILIDHPLTYQPDGYEKRVTTDMPALPAQTLIEPFATQELPIAFDRYPSTRFSLVIAKPKTGRKHQIRRHLKHISHPIIGDANHGKGKLNRWVAAQFGCHRLMLAATRLEFTHPFSGESVAINAPLAEDFLHLVKQLGWIELIPDAWRITTQ